MLRRIWMSVNNPRIVGPVFYFVMGVAWAFWWQNLRAGSAVVTPGQWVDTIIMALLTVGSPLVFRRWERKHPN